MSPLCLFVFADILCFPVVVLSYVGAELGHSEE